MTLYFQGNFGGGNNSGLIVQVLDSHELGFITTPKAKVCGGKLCHLLDHLTLHNLWMMMIHLQ